MTLFSELSRRNIFRVAIAYLAGAWLLIQVLETLFPIFGLPETSIRNTRRSAAGPARAGPVPRRP